MVQFILQVQAHMRAPRQNKSDPNHLLGGKQIQLSRIGTSKKDDAYRELQRRGVPGPGMYESKSGFAGPQYRFGNEKRSFYRTNEIPGPGQYSVPCSIGDVPKYASVGGSFNEAYRKI